MNEELTNEISSVLAKKYGLTGNRLSDTSHDLISRVIDHLASRRLIGRVDTKGKDE